jgi:hypothetical protein
MVNKGCTCGTVMDAMDINARKKGKNSNTLENYIFI